MESVSLILSVAARAFFRRPQAAANRSHFGGERVYKLLTWTGAAFSCLVSSRHLSKG